MEKCLFCQKVQGQETKRVLEWSRHFIVVEDGFPVTEGHCLIIPKEHITKITELPIDAWVELQDVIRSLCDKFQCDYNLGVNCGESAGQTIPHLHIHFIPRRQGDCKDPRGGVRGVIPEKQKY